MEYWVIIAGFAVLILTFLGGVPIWISLSLAAVVLGIFYSGMTPASFPLGFFGSLDSFTLLAIPFFLLGGNLMANCGPAKYLFGAVNAIVGRMPGGLPFATVCTCMVFGAITGSTLATLVAVGSISIPPLMAKGYPKPYCLGIICVSGTLGQLIPPSLYMILYGSYVQENAARLFAGGMVPGIVLGLLLGILAIIIEKRNNWKIEKFDLTWAQRRKDFLKGVPAMIMPLFILGGIYTGVFTPTEAAAIACGYALLISWAFYRELTWKNFLQSVRGTLTTTSMIFLIVAAAILFAGPLTYAQIPQKLTAWLVGFGVGPTAFLYLCVILFLVLGCFLDPLPILYLTVPIMYGPLKTLGIDLTHFCVITIVCMQIAQITPPFGVSLYTTSQLWQSPLQAVIKSSFPFLVLTVLTLPIFIHFPQISIWLPNFFKL